MPDALVPNCHIRNVIEAFPSALSIETQGVKTDDVIATLATSFAPGRTRSWW